MGNAPTTILQSISVLMVLAFVCIKYHRSPRAKEIAGVILAFVGTFLLATDGQIGNLNFPAEGLLWGMGTALTAAAFVILPPKLLETYGSFVVNGFAMLGVGAAFTILVQPWNMMPALDGAWAGVAGVAVGRWVFVCLSALLDYPGMFNCRREWPWPHLKFHSVGLD